jgi:hypothetical protein
VTPDKITKEYLDAMEAYKAQDLWNPHFEPSLPDDLIRLARLGLWAEEHGERALNFIVEEACSEDSMWEEAVRARAALPAAANPE